MADVAWILGVLVVGIIGAVFGGWCMKQRHSRDMRQIQNDVFDIIYDYGEPHINKKPLVIRLKNLDKYFNLDEIREERPTYELFDDISVTNDVATKFVNADGTQALHRRGLNI